MKKQENIKFAKQCFLQSEKLKEILNTQSKQHHETKREKCLPTSVSYLTDEEVSALLSECFENIDKSIAAVFLCVSLFTGKSLNSLLNLDSESLVKKHPDFGGLSVVSFPLRITQFDFDDEIRECIIDVSSDVIMPLPQVISTKLNAIDFDCICENELNESAQKLITKVNEEKGTNITKGKIAKYFYFYLKNQSVSDLFIEIFKDPKVYDYAGVFYCTFQLQDLINTHQDYITYLYDLAEIEYTAVRIKTNKLLGSKLCLTDASVIQLFKRIDKAIHCFKKNKLVNADQIHNLLVVHTILLLNLSTGHRAVNDPYSSLSTMSYELGDIFIEDKKLKDRETARIVPLPQLAINQLKAYHNHLKVLACLINIKIEDVLDSKAPLFFFINGAKKQNIRPKVLRKHIAPFINVQDNWHRHYISTFLHKNSVNCSIIDAWMGHHGKHEINLNKFSGISVFDLKYVAILINDLLQNELNIIVQKGITND